MAALSKYLRSAEGGRLHFWCPGCGMIHGIQTGKGPGPRWTWNEDAEKPTFAPSVLVQWEQGDRYEKRLCHSFVRNGQIQFLGDCTHALAGQTVDLPAWNE